MNCHIATKPIGLTLIWVSVFHIAVILHELNFLKLPVSCEKIPVTCGRADASGMRDYFHLSGTPAEVHLPSPLLSVKPKGKSQGEATKKTAPSVYKAETFFL